MNPGKVQERLLNIAAGIGKLNYRASLWWRKAKRWWYGEHGSKVTLLRQSTQKKKSSEKRWLQLTTLTESWSQSIQQWSRKRRKRVRPGVINGHWSLADNGRTRKTVHFSCSSLSTSFTGAGGNSITKEKKRNTLWHTQLFGQKAVLIRGDKVTDNISLFIVVDGVVVVAIVASVCLLIDNRNGHCLLGQWPIIGEHPFL